MPIIIRSLINEDLEITINGVDSTTLAPYKTRELPATNSELEALAALKKIQIDQLTDPTPDIDNGVMLYYVPEDQELSAELQVPEDIHTLFLKANAANLGDVLLWFPPRPRNGQKFTLMTQPIISGLNLVAEVGITVEGTSKHDASDFFIYTTWMFVEYEQTWIPIG